MKILLVLVKMRKKKRKKKKKKRKKKKEKDLNALVVVKNYLSFGEDMDIDILEEEENVVKEISKNMGFFI